MLIIETKTYAFLSISSVFSEEEPERAPFTVEIGKQA